ncbi:MAG: TolC family protein [bacterium]
MISERWRGEGRPGARLFPRWLCLLLLSMMVGPTPARAELTLAQAVNHALAHNHNVAAKEHALAAAIWAQRQARSQLFPSLSLQSSYTRLDDETVQRANAFGRELTLFFPDGGGGFEPVTIEIPQTVFRDGYETQLTAQMLLFNPQVWNGVALAGASKEVASWQEIVTRQETAHQTLRAFVELLKSGSLLEIQKQHLDQARQNSALAQRLFDVGRYSEADILRWRVEEARQQGELTLQRSNRRVTAMGLENLLGETPTGTVSPADQLPSLLEAQIERFRQLSEVDWLTFAEIPVAQIVAGNPALQLLAGAEDLVGIEHRRSKTNYLPSVALNGSYGWMNNDTVDLDGERTWSASVVLSLPIFTSFSNYSTLKLTRHQMEKTREENEEVRRSLYLSAEVARTGLHSNSELLRLAETSLESARRNHEIQRNQYTLGRLTNLEWLDANLALQGAEQVYSSAYFDLVLAIADYFQARGEILELLVQ